jgi:hypothetical protein
MGDWGRYRPYPASGDWGEMVVPHLSIEDHRIINEAFDRIVKKKIITKVNKRNDSANITKTYGRVPEASEDRD